MINFCILKHDSTENVSFEYQTLTTCKFHAPGCVLIAVWLSAFVTSMWRSEACSEIGLTQVTVDYSEKKTNFTAVPVARRLYLGAAML